MRFFAAGSALTASLLSSPIASALTTPPELFSPLVASKVLATAKSVRNTFPQYTDTSAGNWQFFNADTWTSGFFPATLYELNRRKTLCGTRNGVGSADWVNLGRAWSTGEIPLETHTGVGHDVGFLSFPFVNELEINPTNATAITAVNNFAKQLAGRFNPVVGCTRSWDSANPDFQVIIDNMMNLEVLFVSAQLTGNLTLRDIAISHADKTLVNHIRPDGGTWHVLHYNSNTGAVTSKVTSQGFSDNSTWSRGQAWAIFGFANMYKRTGYSRYLDTARRLATYFVSHIPADGIVPWDFNAPMTPPPRPADSSAATLATNALILLAQQETKVGNSTGAAFWLDSASQILGNITQLAWRPSWQSLLSNGTVNRPAGNSLTGIVYGDYYFIRAGNELKSMGLVSC
ncbi:hypothetical protein HGRIS_013593 [Hohenbuehelia grisea]|uniref:Glycoside hydrolase family 88 protein n=1 Tax=Hohenbuehelia grisea TaxID=104357 RepID=A0ABR3IW93_9AGAR